MTECSGQTRWIIDPAASTHVNFSVTMLNAVSVEGRFGRVEGVVVIDDAPQRSWVDLAIDAASIDTRNLIRDLHLRSADYLDVKRFPTIAFVSTDVTMIDAATYRVSGDLTIHGTTRAISLDVACNEWTTEEGDRCRTRPRPGSGTTEHRQQRSGGSTCDASVK
jgi:polyisoprenoid-binding protein YceI